MILIKKKKKNTNQDLDLILIEEIDIEEITTDLKVDQKITSTIEGKKIEKDLGIRSYYYFIFRNFRFDSPPKTD
jgi:hypothetical protein